MLILGLLAVFGGVWTVVVVGLTEATRGARPEARIRQRLSPYSLRGPGVRPDRGARSTVLGSGTLARNAVDLADRVVASRDLEGLLSRRLDAAAIPLRPGEWSLLHVATATGLGLVLLLVGGGSPATAGLGVVLGLIGPWLLLGVRRGRRENAFLAQLPDTLRMLSGSLQAGHSLPQALEVVARDSPPPVGEEFRRALVQHRLGLPIEDSLEGIATRMDSEDFSWVVLAIRIQREVGGNLAELLTTVSDTLIERQRLRRQVAVLSAEGKLSGWILAALPVGFAGYLLVTDPDYLRPLLTPLGLVLLGTAVVLLLGGIVWISRVVRVRV